MILLFIFTILFILIICSLLISKDLFSPSKFYILYLFIYFGDIFINIQYDFVYTVYIFYIIFGYVIVFFEAIYLRSVTNKFIKNKDILVNEKSILLFFCLISLIPLLSQIYIIYAFGGLISYLNTISMRVIEWQGFGFLISLKRFFPIINIIFLYVGLRFSIKNKRTWWFFYTLHFLLLVCMGLLSGSRGSTLFGFVYLVVLFHFFHKNISIKTLIITIFLLLMTSAVLGNLRNSFDTSDVSLNEISFTEIISEAQLIRYGITPLNILVEDEYFDYKYGTTYLSLITNFVPRKLLPEKFDTGGVVITKFRAGEDSYLGSSNYSPGVMAESIINFGYFGPFFVILILFANFLVSVFFFKKIKLDMTSSFRSFHLFNIFIFLMFLTIPGGLLFGEFTTIFFSFFIKLFLFIIVYVPLVKLMRVEKCQ